MTIIRKMLVGLSLAPALFSTLAMLYSYTMTGSSIRRHRGRLRRPTTTVTIVVLKLMIEIWMSPLATMGVVAVQGVDLLACSNLAARGDGGQERPRPAAAIDTTTYSGFFTKQQSSGSIRSKLVGKGPAAPEGRTGGHRDSSETCESDSFGRDDVEGDDGGSLDMSVEDDDFDYSYESHEMYDTSWEEDASAEGAFDSEEEHNMAQSRHERPHGSPAGSAGGDDSESYAASDEEDDTEDYYYSEVMGEEKDNPEAIGRGDGDYALPAYPQKEGNEKENQPRDPDSVQVCAVTWNLAEASPPARDVEFVRSASKGSDLVAVGVQEIENLKPRRREGRRTREWRRLLIRTLGRDFVRVGHHTMGAVQLTLFARREVFDRVKMIKLTEVVCGVGNVLQNKGGIGAYVRVDRTTFLFVAAHLAAHQTKVEERNANYWRIATTLNQDIPPAWVTHAARKRVKRAGLEVAAGRQSDSDAVIPARQSTPLGTALPPRGPFQDRVDRVFFFGDLNYRVDLSREDLEIGLAVGKRREGEWTGTRKLREQTRGTLRPGVTYPGIGELDHLLDFDQLTLARSRGDAFGGFSEARVTFHPTYKFDKGSTRYDTSQKMRPPAWTDRILFSPAGPQGVSPLEYASVPGSRHSDHRPVYAVFRVQLED